MLLVDLEIVETAWNEQIKQVGRQIISEPDGVHLASDLVTFTDFRGYAYTILILLMAIFI